jgi:protein-L-isoaspartate O-methyltransferase
MTSANAALRVPRELFVPDVIWVSANGGYRALKRQEEPEAWRSAVAADEPVVTQVDDGATPAGRHGDRSSSSSSQPSLVAAMLDAADLQAGMRVLEIGTGTGWTAALLCDRVGDQAVTTIEIDRSLAEQARAALDRVGYHPMVITGEGAIGCAGRAPYDRVLATCAVDQVPYSWVEQTTVGGQILTPWGTDYHNGALTRLIANGHGSASGYFDSLVLAFMRLRSQRSTPCPWDEDGPGEPDLSHTELTSRQIYEIIASPGAFAIGLLLPKCHKVVDETNLIVRIHDPASESWARCDVVRGASSHVVAQCGTRRLWDEAERAHAWWSGQGKPGLDQFGLNVTSTRQTVWLHEPDNAVGSMP